MSQATLRFLRMVAPEDPDTWFNIHRRMYLGDRPDPIFPGNAHKKLRTAMDDVNYWAQKGSCVYISQGMYRNSGMLTTFKYPKADRTYQNLVACKNLYMDVDVKADGGYATHEEMKQAVGEFLVWAKLPWPTVFVGSGSGGWHIYWTMNVAFDRAEFNNMAARLIAAGMEFGLKFDRQCTSDATRLLRVAGTWNFKYADENTPATPVTLDYCRDNNHIDIDAMRKGLMRWPATLTREGKSQVRIPLVDANGIPLENDDLSGGMKHEYAPSDIDEVAKNCPFIADALATGGAGYSEALWKYSLAIASRCIEPEATAHRLSQGHSGYDKEATEQKLAQPHGSGPPSCATVGTVASQCASCKYHTMGSNPLGVGAARPVNNHVLSAAAAFSTTGQPIIDLPAPYYQERGNLLVYKIEPDTGKPTPGASLAFEYPIVPGTATLEAGKPFQFVFATIQGECEVTKRFDSTIVADNSLFAKAMASEGMPLTMQPDLPRKFMASYIKQLQDKHDTLITVPAFGWSLDKNKDMGFAYAGEFVSPAGVVRCSQPPEGTENYRVMGDEQVWIDLMKLIVTPDRPDLACMVAASFGAPLVGMTGENGLLMGVTSPASGIGKSTALLGGQSVWSSPLVGGLSDTVIYTFAKCATLRHLPVFYDEIKGDPQIKNMVNIAFQLTGGREKGRSDRSGKMRKVNEFKTLCGYASNGSIVAGVRQEDKGTDASWLRIFEMEGIRLPETSPNFASNVNHLLTGLQLNHGGIGRRYANLLGRDYANIYKTLAEFKTIVGKQLGANPKVERFWNAAIATTMLGAFLAKSLGVVKVPVVEMQQYMFEQFHRMKQEMAEDPSDYSKEPALMGALGEFLNDKQARNMIFLDKTWTQPMRPPKGYANILNEKTDSAWGKLEVQISGDPLMLRLTDSALTEWCTKSKRPKNLIVDEMKRKMGARMTTGMIGSGSHRAGAKENIWTINAAPGTAIAEYLEYAIHHKFLP